MEKKKVEHQKENLTTTESQEQLVLSTVLSNSNSGTSRYLDCNISMDIRAGKIYDSVFRILGLEKGGDYTIGELITKFRNLGVRILYVGKIKMPPGDVDFSIKEEFTSGFRQRFLENVLFETQEEKNNFEAILKVIDHKVTIGQYAAVDTTGLLDAYSYITIFGSYEDSPDPVKIFVLEIPY